MTATSEPWDRLPAETPPAWEAFTTYRNMGSGRTLLKVSHELGKHVTLLSGWSSQHNWVERCAAWDQKVDQEWQREILRGQATVVQQLLESAMMLRSKAHDRFLTMKDEEIKPEIAVRMMAAAAKMTADVYALARLPDPHATEDTNPHARSVDVADLVLELLQRARGDSTDS